MFVLNESVLVLYCANAEKKDLGEIAYRCEIAGKCQDGVPLCGVEELNTSLGFRTLP